MNKLKVFNLTVAFLIAPLLSSSCVDNDKNYDITLDLPFSDLSKFHARVLCGEGETKKLIMGGVQDDFSLPMNPYVNGQPLGLNPDTNQPFPNAGGYDSPEINHHFFDRLTVPSNISRGYLLFSLKDNGFHLQDNDTIFFGSSASRAANPTNYAGFNTPVAALQGFGFQQTGNIEFSTGAQYLASLSDIPLVNGQTMLDYVQSGNGATHVDTYLQDDTSIDFIAYSLCIRKPEAIVEAVEDSGKDTEIDSYYGPIEIKEYCDREPVILSTEGTTPAHNYWVQLQTFDPILWQGINTITPSSLSGWQCSNNQICPAPPYLEVSDYNNPPGQDLSPNAYGEIYHLKFAIGAVWAEDHYFFRVKRCHTVDDGVSVDKHPSF